MGLVRSVSTLAAAVAFAVTGAAAAATLAPAAAAQQMPPAQPYPVPHSFLAGVPAEFHDPHGSAPGADLPDCRPAPEHPRPVLLVHGFTANRQFNWATVAPFLANHGFCVYSFTYGTLPLPLPLGNPGGLAPMAEIDRQMAAAVADVRARTGAAEIDLVSHSMGSVVATSYAKLGSGADHVHTVVNLAGVIGGQDDPGGVVRTVTDAIAHDPGSSGFVGGRPGVADILAGSERILALNAGGSPYADGVDYTNIVSRHDETIRPYTRGLADGPRATNIVLQDGCEIDHSGHGAVASQPRALAFLHNALSPERPVPVPCLPAGRN